MRQIFCLLVLPVVLMVAGLACNRAGTPATVGPTVAAVNATPRPLATPYALQPAAGICATPAGEWAAMTVNPDVPDPRCLQLSARQKLEIVNGTGGDIAVALGPFSATLAPGAAYRIPDPVGTYLAPGVHQLGVDTCCGGEIWLQP